MHDFWSHWPGAILGAEDPPSEDPPEEPDEDDEDGDEGEDPPETPPADPTEGLKKALAAERRRAKTLERENKKLIAAQAKAAAGEQSDLETLRAAEAAATARAEKLASGLLKRDIDSAIKDAALKLNFLDVTDALDGVDRSAITFDQDDDDPTDIEIDVDTVKAAVKALATKKPHFIRVGTDDGEPTGSQFGGRRKPKPSSEEALKELYPSL